MALTTTTALSYYQLESSTISEWTNPITFSLDALSADDIEVFVINTSASEGSQKLALIEGVDYTLDFAAKTVTCTSSAWSGLSKITGHSANQIRVHRATTSTALVDFTNGAVLNDTDLNLAYKQNLFAAQEMNEDAALTRGGIQSVSEGSLADSAVTTAKIANTAVDSNKLATDAVVTAKIQNAAVNADKLATDAVTTAKIQNSAVDANKLASNAVTTVKILDDAVTYAKVAPASKAEMEGQSAAGVVTPDVLKNSPFSPRAYGVVSYSSDSATPTISNEYNATVTRVDTDRRRITLTAPLANANYVVVVSLESSNDNLDYGPVMVKAKTSSTFDIESASAEGSNMSFHFVVFGSTYSS
tara:strand:- start:1450 stop:2526 length:1077 start_codon:yes stop_codon:yes gene_type:complete